MWTIIGFLLEKKCISLRGSSLWNSNVKLRFSEKATNFKNITFDLYSVTSQPRGIFLHIFWPSQKMLIVAMFFANRSLFFLTLWLCDNIPSFFLYSMNNNKLVIIILISSQPVIDTLGHIIFQISSVQLTSSYVCV